MFFLKREFWLVSEDNTSVIRNGGDDVGRSPDFPTLNCRAEIFRDLWRSDFLNRRDLSLFNLGGQEKHEHKITTKGNAS